MLGSNLGCPRPFLCFELLTCSLHEYIYHPLADTRPVLTVGLAANIAKAGLGCGHGSRERRRALPLPLACVLKGFARSFAVQALAYLHPTVLHRDLKVRCEGAGRCACL
jgi:hypothetical protein